jgi:hypothetical protein
MKALSKLFYTGTMATAVVVAVLYAYSLVFPSSHVEAAVDSEQVDQLKAVMIEGCGLGKSIDLTVEANGSLSIFKRGVEGKFKASKDELPAIIKFLESDEGKIQLSDRMIECTERYMDKIFDLIVDGRLSSPAIDTASAYGIRFDLQSCVPDGTDVVCRLQAGSSATDVLLAIKGPTRYGKNTDVATKLFNQDGNEYLPIEAWIGNEHIRPKIKNGFWGQRERVEKELVREVPVTVDLRFSDAALETTNIAKLALGGAVDGEDYEVIFRDIDLGAE